MNTILYNYTLKYELIFITSQSLLTTNISTVYDSQFTVYYNIRQKLNLGTHNVKLIKLQ